MEITKLNIEGASQSSLMDALKNEYNYDYVYSADNIFVFFIQKYYLRTDSNLLTTIILDFTDRYKCKVEIATGGGATGLLQITWGSEQERNEHIVKFLQKVCEANAWRMIRL